MKSLAKNIGIAVISAGLGYGAANLEQKATTIPKTPDDGSRKSIPAQVEDIRLKLKVNGQDIEIDLGDDPKYRTPKPNESAGWLNNYWIYKYRLDSIQIEELSRPVHQRLGLYREMLASNINTPANDVCTNL